MFHAPLSNMSGTCEIYSAIIIPLAILCMLFIKIICDAPCSSLKALMLV